MPSLSSVADLELPLFDPGDPELRGAAGTVVFVCSATANRDPDVFTDPDRFDITALRPPGAVLTFGNGPHLCPGAHLVRAELAELYGFLAPRMLQPALAGEPVLGAPIGMYPVEALEISFIS